MHDQGEQTEGLLATCPLGYVEARVGEAGVSWIALRRDVDSPPTRDLSGHSESRIFARLRAAFARYLAGEPETFPDIPLDLRGTPFQMSVWRTARTFPWGKTSTYAGLAERMGLGRGSARAIGQALGANPAPILVPCHRFVAANGALGGFSCGLPWKRFLLDLERGNLTRNRP